MLSFRFFDRQRQRVHGRRWNLTKASESKVFSSFLIFALHMGLRPHKLWNLGIFELILSPLWILTKFSGFKGVSRLLAFVPLGSFCSIGRSFSAKHPGSIYAIRWKMIGSEKSRNERNGQTSLSLWHVWRDWTPRASCRLEYFSRHDCPPGKLRVLFALRNVVLLDAEMHRRFMAV